MKHVERAMELSARSAASVSSASPSPDPESGAMVTPERPALPAGREHPAVRELLAFARCEASQAVTRRIVCHLLRGCAACSATIRREAGIAGGRPLRRLAASRPRPRKAVRG